MGSHIGAVPGVSEAPSAAGTVPTYPLQAFVSIVCHTVQDLRFPVKQIRVADMKRGYIRVSKLTPREPQEAALRAAGFTEFGDQGDVWIDIEPRRKPKGGEVHLEWRDRVCRTREGDEVVVASLEAWARSPADGAEALSKLTRGGGALKALDTGKTYSGGEAMGAALDFLADMQAAAQRAATAPARLAAAQRKAREDRDAATAWKEAKRLWADKAVTAAQAAERSGISERTLYRHLGNKETAAFTGGPKRGRGKRK